MKIKRNPRGSLLDGLLSIRGFTQVTLRCVAGDEVTRVLKEVHSRDFEHKGDALQQIVHLSCYRPTKESYAISFARRCRACQPHSNGIYAPAFDCIAFLPSGHFTLGRSILLVLLIRSYMDPIWIPYWFY